MIVCGRTVLRGMVILLYRDRWHLTKGSMELRRLKNHTMPYPGVQLWGMSLHLDTTVADLWRV